MRYLIFNIFMFLFTNTSNAQQIALTFDDLPPLCPCNGLSYTQTNNTILDALQAYKIKAIGFVNEGKIVENNMINEGTAIFQSWIDHGHSLGNHTYSHQSINAIPLATYKADVLKGATISKGLMLNTWITYRYFRYPFLAIGNTPQVRKDFISFLNTNGYKEAPVSLDTMDWVFEREFELHPENQATILANYLAYTKKVFDFYEAAAKTMYGRKIRHIWLLHATTLTALAINDLIKIAKDRGYEFITLDRALRDSVYKNINVDTEAPAGTWMYRQDYNVGKVDWSMVPVPPYPTN